MPSQLYGKTDQPQNAAQAAQIPQPKQLGMGVSSMGASPQEANSPYANFEDIFNHNQAYAHKAAEDTAGKVTGELGDLKGRMPGQGATLAGGQIGGSGVTARQTLAPDGHAASLGLPGATPAAQGQSLLDIQQSSDNLKVNTSGQTASAKPSPVPAPPGQSQLAPGQNSILGDYGQYHANASQKGTSPGGGNSRGDALESVDENGNVVNRDTVLADQQKNLADQMTDNFNNIQTAEADDKKKTSEEEENLKKYHQAAQDIASYKQDDGLALMQGKDPNATAWDAALQAQGGGRDAFSNLDKYFGGYDKDYLNTMEVAEKARQGDLQGMYDKQQGLADQVNKSIDSAYKPGQPGTPGAPTQHASSWDQIDDMLFNGNDFDKVRAELHRAGLTMSAADWGAWGMGEAGVDTPLPTEAFVGALGVHDEQNFQKAKVRMAYFQVMYEYGETAAKSLLTSMMNNPALLDGYMHMHNPGYMARNMRMALEQQGFKKMRETGAAQWQNFWGGSAGDPSAGNQAPGPQSNQS